MYPRHIKALSSITRQRNRHTCTHTHAHSIICAKYTSIFETQTAFYTNILRLCVRSPFTCMHACLHVWQFPRSCSTSINQSWFHAGLAVAYLHAKIHRDILCDLEWSHWNGENRFPSIRKNLNFGDHTGWGLAAAVGEWEVPTRVRTHSLALTLITTSSVY